MTQHEITEGFIRKVVRNPRYVSTDDCQENGHKDGECKCKQEKYIGNYYMILTIDGQRVQRKTRTDDKDTAIEMLAEWRAQAKVGVIAGDTRLRYEAIRDSYLSNGKTRPAASVLRELDSFFKNAYVTTITPTQIKKFRTWREKQPQVVEYKEEIFVKEFELRKLRAQNGHTKKLNAEQIAKIQTEARQWVENGVKATTNRRLTILRAMFNLAAKEELIQKSDIPASFCLWSNVDNVKKNKFTEEQFAAILKELSPHLHPLLVFLYNTGMRSGQAKAMTWEMIDENDFLVIPGEFTKNGDPFALPLVDENKKPYDWSKPILKTKSRPHGEPIFSTTNFRSEWRRACHKLKLGIFNEETQEYRGAEPHDFRRTGVSNLIARGVPESVAMQISGHKTNSMFKRYGITDQRQVQNAFSLMRKSGPA